MGYEYIDLDTIDIDYKIIEKIPIDKLILAKALPIKEDDLNIYIAFENPNDTAAWELIQKLFSTKIVKTLICKPTQIEKYLYKLSLNSSIKTLVDNIRNELTAKPNKQDQNSSIVKLIEVILETVIRKNGSDIHIEPTKDSCIIRGRIDGLLSEIFRLDKDIYPPLSSRVKLLSNLDIAEKRKPQDGRFSATINKKEYDFRISTLPILDGESLVIRILDKTKVALKLKELGMRHENYSKFSKTVKSPHGIIFVTGPTGSGKTTTLYATLNAIKSVEQKIITVEDPIEYQLDLIYQTQVNQKIGLTFALALRSILRQDPDTIMIGEVRDKETLQIAIQASLTGHLVFSTLHTNDAISAVTRLLDMGIESYLVSGALVAIEAQRLVRKVCPHCKQPISLPAQTLKEIEYILPENYQFYKSFGCEKCSNTGYKGREMVCEILLVSEQIASMIAKGADKQSLLIQATKEGFISLYEDGIIKASKGITTLEEVLRVAKA